MWLWHPADHWVFNVAERAAQFEAFSDVEQFGEAASRLAQQAASRVLALRERFDSIESAARYLAQAATDGFWQNYQAGIAAALVGDMSAAATRFQAVAATPATVAWISEAQARAKRLSDSFASTTRAREVVAAEVARTRGSLGLPALPAGADPWAATGRIAA
jgi:hypothetical protein